jgi:dihydrofolate reductase
MGKLVVTEFVTLDGVGQAPGGPDEDHESGFVHGGWQAPLVDEASGEAMFEQASTMDALLLGRKTYDIFADYWPNAPEEIPFTALLNRVPKYVASRGTPELSWDASTQITDVGAEVRDLRERHEQIHTWGSANLLQTLFREGLVDQVNLWVYPVVLGQGKKLFPEGTAATRLEQVEPPKSFPGGVVLMRYRCLEGPPETVNMAEAVDAETGR